MKVKLQQPYHNDGFQWPAGKTVDVSNKFAAKLKAGGYLDKPKPQPKPKSAPKQSTPTEK
jgi:hypothetical protein